jgi:hypothetical protein
MCRVVTLGDRPPASTLRRSFTPGPIMRAKQTASVASVDRRTFLRAGVLGAGGLALPDLLRCPAPVG